MSDPQIRPPAPGDLEDLVRIYNRYVEGSHITFDTTPFTAEERRGWLEGFSVLGPYRLLVAAAEPGIVGYASSSRFRIRPRWRCTSDSAFGRSVPSSRWGTSSTDSGSALV